MCDKTPEVRDILKILWKRGEIAPNFSSFPQYFFTCCSISMFRQGPDFHFEKRVRDSESQLYIVLSILTDMPEQTV